MLTSFAYRISRCIVDREVVTRREERQEHADAKMALRRFHDVYLDSARMRPGVKTRNRIAALSIMRNSLVGVWELQVLE